MKIYFHKVFDARIEGIKCDEVNCNYEDDDVSKDNLALYLDRPCPQCGANLLTLQDLRKLESIFKVTRRLRWFKYPSFYPQTEVVMEMDGSGTIRTKSV